MARGFNYKLTKAFGATEHVMTVVSVRDITPSFRRIRFHAPTIIDGRETPTASFIRMWARDVDDPDKLQQRGYTLIDPDAATGEVSFDFVLHHPAGPAGYFAANAKPGDTITGSYMSFTKFELPDPEPEGYLLLGDPSAIPAINAILDVLPRDAQVVVVVEIISDGDETIPISEHPGATVTWVPKHVPSRLGEYIPKRDWSNWRAWLAGESKTVKEVRALLNTVHGFPLADIEHRAYWMRGKAMRLAKEREAKALGKSGDEIEPQRAEATAPVAQPSGRWRSQRGKELLASIRWKLRVAGVMQAFISVMQLIPFILLAEVGRRLLDGQTEWQAFRTPVLGALVSFGAAALLSAALMVWLHTVDANFGRDLRRSVVAKLARLPLGWFSDRNSASVRQAVQDDAARLHYMVTHAVPDFVAGAVTPIVVLVYLFTVDSGLAAMLFLPTLVMVWLYSIMMRGNGDNLARVADWTKKVNAATSAFVGALPVVRVFGGDGRQIRQALNGQLSFLNNWQRPMAAAKALSQIVIQPSTFLLLIVSVGMLKISYGGMTIAELLPFIFLGTTFGAQILAMLYGLAPIREGRGAALRIGVLLEEKELDLDAITDEIPQGPIGLHFDRMTFGYRPRVPILHDIDLDLKPGTMTALVGPSGAGKSTLAVLPGRFHDVTGGAIKLTCQGREIDIRNLRPEVLQRCVGFVFQDVQLIRGTIRENIALSNPAAGNAEIEAAARTAQIHDRIARMPRGYLSVVGEDAYLSGGEAQRLSIARALLANPPVLILDEATAFADPESEHLVQHAITSLVKNRTVLVVAHRLHTIVGADCIAVMRDGRIVQHGRHEELLAQDGLYRQLWKVGEEIAA